MSATSEELAAHAEQLQTSVAFFRMETGTHGGAPPHRAVASPPQRRVVHTAATHRSAKAAVARPAPARNGNAIGPDRGNDNRGSDKGKGNGFALNLTTGGADPRDAEFERM
jgi:methyl-accepting chemotaxis protein